jgi:two-component system sensor histidine kinase BaeS
MQSIKKRLSIILISCSVIGLLLCTLFVNVIITNTFNNYMVDIQQKRDARLVEYFQQVYRKDGQWTKVSGEEMNHEAYMNNYCLTLLDSNKNVVWEMDHNDIKYKSFTTLNGKQEEGVYTDNTFEINVGGQIVGYLMIGQYSPVLLSKEDISFKSNINKSITASVIITIALVSLISFLLSKQFSSPIKAVSDTSVSLSKGNYEARSSVKSNIEEINNLIYSINTLGEKLNSQDLLRKRLISDVSHEIRTPLNILQNNLEAMVDGIVPATAEKLNSLNDEVIRFGKLLNNLNALKELESEDIELHMEQIEIDKLVSSVCEDFSVAASEKNLSIIINKEEDKKYFVLGDMDKLRQVFINLISNAVKFSKDDGKVLISIKNNKEFTIVQIKDNGAGIKKEDIPFIFERMYRGDKSRNKIEGSGIGLTIVKRILTKHSATIDVESKENKETIFTVHFKKNKNYV